jgi:hypothetical protein
MLEMKAREEGWKSKLLKELIKVDRYERCIHHKGTGRSEINERPLLPGQGFKQDAKIYIA